MQNQAEVLVIANILYVQLSGFNGKQNNSFVYYMKPILLLNTYSVHTMKCVHISHIVHVHCEYIIDFLFTIPGGLQQTLASSEVLSQNGEGKE